jgi:hypothetical protein
MHTPNDSAPQNISGTANDYDFNGDGIVDSCDMYLRDVVDAIYSITMSLESLRRRKPCLVEQLS